MIFYVSEKKLCAESPAITYTVLSEMLQSEDRIASDKEHFWALHLNTRNIITCVELVSLGTVNSSLVHPREVFRRAICEGSSAIIIAHNHPSGYCEPSYQDIELTQRLLEAGVILGIDLLDHLIHHRYWFLQFQGAGQALRGSLSKALVTTDRGFFVSGKESGGFIDQATWEP